MPHSEEVNAVLDRLLKRLQQIRLESESIDIGSVSEKSIPRGEETRGRASKETRGASPKPKMRLRAGTKATSAARIAPTAGRFATRFLGPIGLGLAGLEVGSLAFSQLSSRPRGAARLISEDRFAAQEDVLNSLALDQVQTADRAVSSGLQQAQLRQNLNLLAIGEQETEVLDMLADEHRRLALISRAGNRPSAAEMLLQAERLAGSV